MKVYLVDFENVKSKGLTGVDKLTEYDRVIIFYSENADTINFEMHQKVMMSKADVEYFKVNVGGKNALDFQLSTLLGYLVATRGYSHLFVISNDKSFDFLHDFWHGKYITSPDCIVYRTRTIAAAINYSGVKRVDEGIDDIADETDSVSAETEQEISAAQTAQTQSVSVSQAMPALLAPPEILPAQQPVEAVENKQSVTAEKEEKSEEKSAKLDDSELFEYYQQFFSNAKLEIKGDDVKIEEDVKIENEKPIEDKAEVSESVSEQQETRAKEKQKSEKPLGDSYMKILSEALEGSGCTRKEIELIGQLLIASETKEEFHNSLAKEFKQKATELYKGLRPKYLRLKEKCAAENAADEAHAQSDNAEVSAAPEQTKQEVNSKAEAAVQNDKPEKKTSGRKKKQENVSEGESEAQNDKSEKKTSGRKKKQDNVSEGEGEVQNDKPEKKALGRKKKQDNSPETEATVQPEEAVQSDTAKAAASPRDRLAQLLDGICTEEELDVICELFDNANTKQQLYIRMVKAFGKDKGCKFYNAIKSEYSAIKN